MVHARGAYCNLIVYKGFIYTIARGQDARERCHVALGPTQRGLKE